jgi:hypothetical protein
VISAQVTARRKNRITIAVPTLQRTRRRELS